MVGSGTSGELELELYLGKERDREISEMEIVFLFFLGDLALEHTTNNHTQSHTIMQSPTSFFFSFLVDKKKKKSPKGLALPSIFFFSEEKGENW